MKYGTTNQSSVLFYTYNFITLLKIKIISNYFIMLTHLNLIYIILFKIKIWLWGI